MGLSGFLSAFASVLVALLVLNNIAYQIAGWTVRVILIVLFFVTIRQGIQTALGAVAAAVTGVTVPNRKNCTNPAETKTG